MAVAELFVLSLVVAALVAVVFYSGAYVLRPLDLAARNRRVAPGFTVPDILLLIFQLALFLSLIQHVDRVFFGWPRSIRGVLSVAASVIVLLVWWTTIRVAGAAGIHQTVRRLAMTGLVVPAAIIMALTLSGALFAFVGTVFFVTESAWIPALIAGCSLVILFLLRRSVEWILERRTVQGIPTPASGPPHPVIVRSTVVPIAVRDGSSSADRN